MKLSDPKPVACSVCLQPPMLNPDQRFVDFEVVHEGPVINRYGEDKPENFTAMPLDDLHICEECLRAGAKLIGMEGAEDIRDQLAQKNAELEALRVELKDKDAAISNLTYTVGTLVDHPIKRPTGKPKIVGPEDKADELAEVRKRRRIASSVSKTAQTKKEKVS